MTKFLVESLPRVYSEEDGHQDEFVDPFAGEEPIGLSSINWGTTTYSNVEETLGAVSARIKSMHDAGIVPEVRITNIDTVDDVIFGTEIRLSQLLHALYGLRNDYYDYRDQIDLEQQEQYDLELTKLTSLIEVLESIHKAQLQTLLTKNPE